MKEHALTFGPDGSLVGVITEPTAGTKRAGAPALLLANVGMNHRVGPYRAYVDLARRAASLGFSVLRFDLSGLGDSAVRPGRGGDAERWVEDMRDAMATMQARSGAREFAVVGLCSGVDTAHAVAVADPRIVAAVFVDGYAYTTPKHEVRRRVAKALRLRTWEVFLKRRAPSLFGLPDDAHFWSRERAPVFVRPPVTREQLRRDLGALLDRGARLYFVYTGQYEAHFSHVDQFHEMVRPLATRGRVRVEIHRAADHTFSMVADRARLVQSIAAWLDEQFPAAAQQSASATR